MYPKKLKEHKQTYYYHWEFFKNHLDITNAFIEKNFQAGMHEQEFFEINIVIKGRGMHYIDNSRTKAKTGDVFIIPPHVRHGYYGGEGFDVCHILISDNFINKYISDLQQLPSFYVLFSAEPIMRANTKSTLHLSLNNVQFKQLLKSINELMKHQDHFDPFDSIKRSSLTMILITLLCEIYAKNTSSLQAKSSEDEAFMQSISFIHEHYFEKITIADLVKIAKLSRSAYIRKFKEICKMPPSSYVAKRRIEAAENMLVNTQLSITEIAYRTGFYDSAHFSKSFEAEIGITPLAYRKQRITKR